LIAFGLQIVGALLIVALLIIPPAVARPFARTPEGMAIIAALVGAAAAPLGIFTAFVVDAPAGPMIVLAASALFALSSATARFLRG
jgi:zinc transport system permease protein